VEGKGSGGKGKGKGGERETRPLSWDFWLRHWQARITKSSLCAAPRTIVFVTKFRASRSEGYPRTKTTKKVRTHLKFS